MMMRSAIATIRRFQPPLAQIGSAILIAFLAARLAYVWAQRDSYLNVPLDIVDIRDGGWVPAAGLIAGWGYALVFAKVPLGFRKPLVAVIGITGFLWMAGFATIVLSPGNDDRFTAAVPRGVKDGAALLAEFNGKPTVVNLWASWCPPCLHEMPLLLRVQAGHPELNVVFLNQGESAARTQGFLASRALPLRNVLLDPTSEIGREIDKRDLANTLFFGADGHPVDQDALPRTLFFDAKGRLVDVHLGELSPDVLTQRLQRLSHP
jgi:thiol-disulfide isomerase/thioredoxin